MKEIFDLLTRRERKALLGLCVLLACGFVFYIFAVKSVKGSYTRSLEMLAAKQGNLQALQARNLEAKINRSEWREAIRDMDEIKEKYFYKKENKLQQVMIDMQELLHKSSLRADRKKYEYSEFKEGGIDRVTVSFEISGPYSILKKFLDNVESFPRFITIEKIDFVNIDTQSGRLTLNVKLAGYYGR